ncbi:MAG: hypothetical protein H6558_03190 [Lewinellaceae bacterium]|nr:hypothetical protein [Lewinellaceae bacterium]MCB9289915.1 hypothetical protein [Lewinellaceae bacterium]
MLAQNATITPKINSPFSRFGLGNFISQYYAGPGGMGGLSAAFQDPYLLNTLNPASLASLQATAFEVGLNAQYSGLKSDGASEGIWSGNLDYLALGFPLINPINEVLDRKRSGLGLGMAFALQPYTVVGYNIESTSVQEELGPTTNYLKGTGGTNRLMWSNALRYKGLSGGFTFGYMFGQLTNSRRVEFDSLELAYVTEFLDEVSLNGFFWEAGLQYTHDFKKLNAEGERESSGRRLTVGLYGNSTDNFNTNTRRFAERYSFDFNVQDTIVDEPSLKQKGALPSSLTVGVMYEDVNDFRFGLEYGMENWSEYVNEAKPDSTLLDTWRFRAGVEWIPDYQSYNNYFERMRYRFGFFYGLDPRSFGGEQLKEYGVSVGFGFPIIMSRQRVSFINLSVEAGQFGLADTLQETFVKMTLGFTLNDNTWFFKRKFN